MNFDQIVSEMTLEEKALLLTGTGDMETAKLEKYGVRKRNWQMARMAFDTQKKKTAHFPNLCCLGATLGSAARQKNGKRDRERLCGA